MGTRYTWTKALITTENRDRPGGHGHTYATDGMGCNEPCSPAGAKFLKRRTRRAQRREHARITREAIQSFYEDQELDLHELMLMDLDNDGYDDEPMDWEDYDDNPFDDYHDDYSYDPYPYDPYDDHNYRDWYHSAWAYAREEDPHDRIIKHEDAGKSLGEILEEMLKEIRARKV